MSASDVLTTVTSRSLMPEARETARQQVVRHRQLDEVDLAALDVRERRAVLEHDAVIAVGEVADDEPRRADATRGGDSEGVHVRHRATVEGAGRVLVDRLDVVVDLYDLDVDAVLVRPLVDDALPGAVVPRHPADVDRPADAEAVPGLCARREQDRGTQGEQAEVFHRGRVSCG